MIIPLNSNPKIQFGTLLKNIQSCHPPDKRACTRKADTSFIGGCLAMYVNVVASSINLLNSNKIKHHEVIPLANLAYYSVFIFIAIMKKTLS